VAEGVGRETDGEMPQLQLPIFPADVTPINQQVAVSCESGKVVYVHGLLPVFPNRQTIRVEGSAWDRSSSRGGRERSWQ
jgi:hypothetical protein